jgi:hypothetical protein
MGYGVFDLVKSTAAKVLRRPSVVKDSDTEVAAWSPVGWGVASFAAETFMPEDGAKTTITTVWHKYLAWCREWKWEPLFYPLFVIEFDRVMAEAGVPRVQQGANVYYRTLGLTSI